ncbi:MAG TPA: CoA-transferase [Bdellovibrionota bacterium]|nr:CoA-transferase [Bdellovibrionota bacterium]
MDIKPSEKMVCRAAKELHDGDVVFVGIGMPNVACNLARYTHAPNLFMIYESGAVGTRPDRLPVSIGDPALVTDSASICSVADIFQNYLQRGNIAVGFLGGAQIDRFGNLNSTVIGSDYDKPKVRLPGSGGACEIAIHSKKILIVMKMSPKSFVDRCDFITSPGRRFFQEKRGPSFGAGPEKIITDLGVLGFDAEDEMILEEIYEGVKVEDVQAACGWKLKIAPQLKTLPAPSKKEIDLLRNQLDPQGLYI